MLREWKRTVEAAVRRALEQAMPSVTFVELELVTRSLLAGSGSVSCDYRQIPPTEKMRKNGLTELTQQFLLVAIGQARTVHEFVQRFTITDENFASRLRAGFTEKYVELKAHGLEGDELFSELQLFASSGRSEFKWQAAGLAVLGYFFEACEVFEK